MEFTDNEKKVFSKMGKLGGTIGGNKTKKKYGKKYYSKIGKMGGRPKKKAIDNSIFDKEKQIW